MQLNDQTVLFHKIQFSVSLLFALGLNVKYTIDRTLSGAITPSKCGPWRGNEEKFHISRRSSITGDSLSENLMLYQDNRWGVLLLCRDTVGVFNGAI